MKNKKSRLGTFLLVFALIAVIAVSSVAIFTGCENKNANTDTPIVGDNSADVEVDNTPSGTNGYSMPRAMTFSMPTVVSETLPEESGVLLNATVTPDNAYDKTVDWSTEFITTSDVWVNDKNVDDYIVVNPISDGALSARVICLKPFAVTIQVKVASRANPDKYAVCLVDYLKRPTVVTYTCSEGSESPFLSLDFNKGTSEVQNIDMVHKFYTDVVPSLGYSETDVGSKSAEIEFNLQSVISDTLWLSYRDLGVGARGSQICDIQMNSEDEGKLLTFNRFAFENILGGISSESWNKMIEAVEANTDTYDFKLVLTMNYKLTNITETREILFKINPSSLVLVESITLENGEIYF